jgi:hypothetical protein
VELAAKPDSRDDAMAGSDQTRLEVNSRWHTRPSGTQRLPDSAIFEQQNMAENGFSNPTPLPRDEFPVFVSHGKQLTDEVI